jgi:hypothetical protein
MNSNKNLRVYEYFEKLVDRLDLVVSKLIKYNAKDQELLGGLNEQRTAFVKEIRDVEAYNLKFLSSKSAKLGEIFGDENLFPKFCFFCRIC